jgi:hypothetical protein
MPLLFVRSRVCRLNLLLLLGGLHLAFLGHREVVSSKLPERSGYCGVNGC